MVAQRRPLVLRPEQAPLDQDRHDLVDELLDRPRQVGRHDGEAVGGAAPEPGLEVVGDLLRRADHQPVVARENRCRLLFVGDDFARTDVERVL